MKQITQALIDFQAEVDTIHKNSVGVHGSKYAQLPDVMKAVLPVLKKHGLAIVQAPSNIEGAPSLLTTLLHTSGESIKAEMPLVLAKNDPQAQGGSITYARRYALAGMLGLVIDEDDDADKATASVKTYGQHQKEFPATPKQRSFIKSLLEKQGVTKEDMQGFLQEQFNVDPDQPMSIIKAKEVIEALNENN